MNRDGDVNYKSYSDKELHEAHEFIRPDKSPINYHNLRAEIVLRGISIAPHSTDKVKGIASPEKPAKHLSVSDLSFTTVLSLLLLVYTAYGLSKDDVVFPHRYGSDHLHGIDGWVFFAFVVVAVATNSIRLYARLNDKNDRNKLYQYGHYISLVALFVIIFYFFVRSA